MTKSFELLNNYTDDSLNTSQMLEVCIAEGQRERGDWFTPDYYEPDHVTHVYDEDGNDITDWAVKHIGEDTLLRCDHKEINHEEIAQP